MRDLHPLNVSRETLDRLEVYAALLEKWQKAINLVSPSTITDAWDRHIRDSCTLIPHVPPTTKTWVDLGSGAGFPGLVCAIVLAERQPSTQITLVESDQRKCSFLREVSRQTGANVSVCNARIESVTPMGADLISARALAPLPKLCALAAPHLVQNGLCLFQKGANHPAELAAAQADWHFTYESVPSFSDPESVLLILKNLRHGTDPDP